MTDEADPLPSHSREGAKKARFRLARPTTTARQLRNNSTEVEKRLWFRLRNSQLGGFKFSRQMPLAGYVADFVCREHKLIVELDGSQHVGAGEYDAVRTAALERIGYRVLRFWNNDLTTNMDGVLETILAECQRLAESEGASPIASPPACGRGPRGGPPLSTEDSVTVGAPTQQSGEPCPWHGSETRGARFDPIAPSRKREGRTR